MSAKRANLRRAGNRRMRRLRDCGDGMTTREYIATLRRLNGCNVVGRIANGLRREVEHGFVSTQFTPAVQATYDADWLALPF